MNITEARAEIRNITEARAEIRNLTKVSFHLFLDLLQGSHMVTLNMAIFPTAEVEGAEARLNRSSPSNMSGRFLLAAGTLLFLCFVLK